MSRWAARERLGWLRFQQRRELLDIITLTVLDLCMLSICILCFFTLQFTNYSLHVCFLSYGV